MNSKNLFNDANLYHARCDQYVSVAIHRGPVGFASRIALIFVAAFSTTLCVIEMGCIVAQACCEQSKKRVVDCSGFGRIVMVGYMTLAFLELILLIRFVVAVFSRTNLVPAALACAFVLILLQLISFIGSMWNQRMQVYVALARSLQCQSLRVVRKYEWFSWGTIETITKLDSIVSQINNFGSGAFRDAACQLWTGLGEGGEFFRHVVAPRCEVAVVPLSN